MTRASHELLEITDRHGVGLRVRFTWQEKHFGHLISIVDDANEYPLLVSVEGDNRQAYPPSPALQQLAIETLPNGGQTAMLIGMADRNHWSVCIQPTGQTNELLFDVACRCADPNHRLLGSTYLSGGLITAFQPECLIQVDECAYHCLLSAAEPAASPPSTLALHDSRLVIQPATAPLQTTLRWCYRVRVLNRESA